MSEVRVRRVVRIVSGADCPAPGCGYWTIRTTDNPHHAPYAHLGQTASLLFALRTMGVGTLVDTLVDTLLYKIPIKMYQNIRLTLPNLT